MDMSFFNKWIVIFMDLTIKDFNCSVLDAAAIWGNSGHESGGFQSLQEKKPIVKGSRGGYGVMQWTGPRRRAYEAYCKRNNLDPADMMSNYKFFFVEMIGSEGKDGKVISRIREAKTLDDKTEVFMKEFLRPGIEHLDSRKVWARRALKAWENQKGKPVEPLPEPVQPENPNVVVQPGEPEKTPEKHPVWLLLIQLIVKIFMMLRGSK